MGSVCVQCVLGGRGMFLPVAGKYSGLNELPMCTLS